MKNYRRVKIVKNIVNSKDPRKNTFDGFNNIKTFVVEFIGEIKDEAIPLIIEDFKIEFKIK
jgi:hypothetical protein